MLGLKLNHVSKRGPWSLEPSMTPNYKYPQWNGNVVILMTFSSMAALKIVILKTFRAAFDENIVKMATSSFQCTIISLWSKVIYDDRFDINWSKIYRCIGVGVSAKDCHVWYKASIVRRCRLRRQCRVAAQKHREKDDSKSRHHFLPSGRNEMRGVPKR